MTPSQTSPSSKNTATKGLQWGILATIIIVFIIIVIIVIVFIIIPAGRVEKKVESSLVTVNKTAQDVDKIASAVDPFVPDIVKALCSIASDPKPAICSQYDSVESPDTSTSSPSCPRSCPRKTPATGPYAEFL